MNKEAEEAYNQRQSEPLFKSAKDMIPMDQVKEHFENLVCGNAEKTGCKVQKDAPNLYYCRVCMLIQSLGTHFFDDEIRLTDSQLYQMSPQQHEQYDKRREYNNKWLDNYPMGASQ